MAIEGTTEQAFIRLMSPSTSGAGSQGAVPKEVSFQFNPKEYSIRKGASWDSNPSRSAKSTSLPEFKGAEPRSMTVEVFLDATNPQKTTDVKADVETLFECCTPDKETIAKKKPSPPFVMFRWGNTMSFMAFVKEVSAKYTLFSPDGTPIRATASVTLQEIPSDDPTLQNPTSGGSLRRSHTVVTGDSLQSIAYREYGNAARWRTLADANGIDDPMRLPDGTHLLVPPPEHVTLQS